MSCWDMSNAEKCQVVLLLEDLCPSWGRRRGARSQPRRSSYPGGRRRAGKITAPPRPRHRSQGEGLWWKGQEATQPGARGKRSRTRSPHRPEQEERPAPFIGLLAFVGPQVRALPADKPGPERATAPVLWWPRGRRDLERMREPALGSHPEAAVLVAAGSA